MAQTISSTKNIKGNRKVVVAQYITEMIFKIPDGLDLEDKAIVKDYHVKYDKLWINYVDGRQEECECYCECESDFKYPHETKIYEPNDVGYTDDIYDDEEEEEQYQEKCPHCEKTLCIDTNIMCWEGEKGEERTLCMECYMDYEYWKTDMNECNWKQELDWGNGCEESSDESDDEFEGIDFTKTNEIIAELKK